jgi:hypothetical protein
MTFKVTVYFIGTNRSQTLSTIRSFTDETRARQYAENEASYEDTRRVVCPELNIHLTGDYEFTRK